MTIGVMGCLPRMPEGFPVATPENAGNMIHANAPFEMFDDCVFSGDGAELRRRGYGRFSEFVNKECSHLILTLANTLRLGATDGTKYERMLTFLQTIERPIVVFGLGAQARTRDLDRAKLPAAAIAVLQHIGRRSTTIGVRGPFTAEVLRRLCGLDNVVVTGCPSLFSRPDGLAELRANLGRPDRGVPVFSGTRYDRKQDRRMLATAAREGDFLFEPSDAENHSFHLKAAAGTATPADVPANLRPLVSGFFRQLDFAQLVRFFAQRYRLFTEVEPWYAFNREQVSFTYGTRFHVNMASILSGKPALWVTHDSRTEEMSEFMHLPRISLDRAARMTSAQLRPLALYDDFFRSLPGLFDNFNAYLTANGLPTVRVPALADDAAAA